jgi:hypothetical protein
MQPQKWLCRLFSAIDLSSLILSAQFFKRTNFFVFVRSQIEFSQMLVCKINNAGIKQVDITKK